MSYRQRRQGTFQKRANLLELSDHEKWEKKVKPINNDLNSDKQWKDHDIDTLVDKDGYAYKIAEAIINTHRLTKTSQLRKFYEEALKIQTALQEDATTNAKTHLAMLKPRLAYQYGRGYISKIFLVVMESSLSSSKFDTENIIQFRINVDRFLKFFEGIIGYYSLFREWR